MKFRKRPVVIDAVRYTGKPEDRDELCAFMGMGYCERVGDGPSQLIIRTLEGDMVANIGDWVIRGVNRELYPCKPDIFEKTYDYDESNPLCMDVCVKCSHRHGHALDGCCYFGSTVRDMDADRCPCPYAHGVSAPEIPQAVRDAPFNPQQ